MISKNNIISEALNLKERLFEIRRNFHREPEIGNHEYKTAEKIEKFFDELGVHTKRILNTAVVARIDGKEKGKCVAFRADMDALPVDEKTGVDFSSEIPGIMHACGHDVHMAALLGAAELIKIHKNDFSGSVIFLFQPDEEGNGGAERMIKAGCLENVDAVFGAHVSPEIPSGHIGVRYGKFYASSAMFKITLIGKSSHGAERNKGIDAIEAAANLVTEILKIQGGVISVGTFNSGTAGNIIADKAEIKGIIRALGIDERSKICNEVLKVVSSISDRFGVKSDCEIKESYPGVVNDEKMTLFVENSAKDILGAEKVHEIKNPTMMTEDFGYFLMNCPGSFYHIGAGCKLPLHNNSFLPSNEAIITASIVHAFVGLKFLERDDLK